MLYSQKCRYLNRMSVVVACITLEIIEFKYNRNISY